MILKIARPVLRRVRWGCLPAEAERLIPCDQRVVDDELIWVTQTFLNFRSPRRYSSARKKGAIGSIAVSNQRLIGYTGHARLVNVVLDDPRLQEIEFRSTASWIGMTFDAGLFQPEWSGTLSYRFHTPHAAEVYDCVESAKQGVVV